MNKWMGWDWDGIGGAQKKPRLSVIKACYNSSNNNKCNK